MTLTCQLRVSKKNLVVPEAANEVEQFTHCNKPSFARARLETCCYWFLSNYADFTPLEVIADFLALIMSYVYAKFLL